jgi:hypothetical protein
MSHLFDRLRRSKGTNKRNQENQRSSSPGADPPTIADRAETPFGPPTWALILNKADLRGSSSSVDQAAVIEKSRTKLFQQDLDNDSRHVC